MVQEKHCCRTRLVFLLIGGIIFTLFESVSSQRQLVRTLNSKRGHNVGLRMCLVHPRNCRGGFKKRAKLKSSLSNKEEVISKEWLWILQTVRSANREEGDKENELPLEDSRIALPRRLTYHGMVSGDRRPPLSR